MSCWIFSQNSKNLHVYTKARKFQIFFFLKKYLRLLKMFDFFVFNFCNDLFFIFFITSDNIREFQKMFLFSENCSHYEKMSCFHIFSKLILFGNFKNWSLFWKIQYFENVSFNRFCSLNSNFFDFFRKCSGSKKYMSKRALFLK